MPSLRLPTRNCAVTVAGSDSGAGAGIQADLRTFHALGVHGTTVITCLTAQTPAAVTAVSAVSSAMVRSQLMTLASELPLRALKTGMLYQRATVSVVADFLESRPELAAVVDPVMIATSGAVLMKNSAVTLIRERLIPLATVSTPNLDEVQFLLGISVQQESELSEAARAWWDRFGSPVLIKGGHLDSERAVDIFFDGQREELFEAERVRGAATHGTGCTYSAAIAALMANGHRILPAIRLAKAYITQCIETRYRMGRFEALNLERVL